MQLVTIFQSRPDIIARPAGNEQRRILGPESVMPFGTLQMRGVSVEKEWLLNRLQSLAMEVVSVTYVLTRRRSVDVKLIFEFVVV